MPAIVVRPAAPRAVGWLDRGVTDLLYLGCYTPATGGAGVGISVVDRDPGTGALRAARVVVEAPSPSFLARHPRLPVLYAVHEVDEGALSAWAAGPGGALRRLDVRATGGGQPCHVAAHPAGGHVFAANYATGSVAVLPLDAAGAPGERTDLIEYDGRGPVRDRQERPHVHMVASEPGGEVFVTDLGTDTVHRYAFDPAPGRLVPAGPPLFDRPGTGPRHVARDRAGRRYVVGELDGSVAAYEIDATGAWRERARVPATGHAGQTLPSEVVVSADDRFLYVANRGPDTIAVFALDDGRPRYLAEVPTGGEWPRHFIIVDDWLYVANQRSHSVVALHIDPATGVPAATGTRLETPSPTCVLPAARA
jgi:6-phosphogluconolactonase (cycloisomerase 2 family)